MEDLKDLLLKAKMYTVEIASTILFVTFVAVMLWYEIDTLITWLKGL